MTVTVTLLGMFLIILAVLKQTNNSEENIV